MYYLRKVKIHTDEIYVYTSDHQSAPRRINSMQILKFFCSRNYVVIRQIISVKLKSQDTHPPKPY